MLVAYETYYVGFYSVWEYEMWHYGGKEIWNGLCFTLFCKRKLNRRSMQCLANHSVKWTKTKQKMHAMHDVSSSVEENIKMQCLDEDLTMQKQVNWKKPKTKWNALWYRNKCNEVS